MPLFALIVLCSLVPKPKRGTAAGTEDVMTCQVALSFITEIMSGENDELTYCDLLRDVLDFNTRHLGGCMAEILKIDKKPNEPRGISGKLVTVTACVPDPEPITRPNFIYIKSPWSAWPQRVEIFWGSKTS
jgi:hypothetical protein